MVRNYQNASDIGAREAIRQANRNNIRSGDLLQPTLSTVDRYFPIFQVVSTKTRQFSPGFGSDDRNRGRTGFADLDLQDNGGGPIEGNVRYALYSDETLNDPLRFSGDYSANELRLATGQPRTEKVDVPLQLPAGEQDRVLVLELQPDSGSTGSQVDSANSSADIGMPYSEFRQ